MQTNLFFTIKVRLGVIMFLCLAFAEAQLATFTSATDQLLSSHVTSGMVDYKSIKKDPTNLNQALRALKKINLEDLSLLEKEAVWINAYNIFVIKGIVEAYPVNSVNDIPDFFDARSYTLGNQKVSLNQLEKEILFKEIWDERLHFALVCGAVGCPPLSKRAFTEANTQIMLQRLTKRAINNPSLVQIDMHEKKVIVSKIFEWYKSDFTKNQSLIEYLNQYRDQKIPDGFAVAYQEYDWNLNDL